MPNGNGNGNGEGGSFWDTLASIGMTIIEGLNPSNWFSGTPHLSHGDAVRLAEDVARGQIIYIQSQPSAFKNAYMQHSANGILRMLDARSPFLWTTDDQNNYHYAQRFYLYAYARDSVLRSPTWETVRQDIANMVVFAAKNADASRATEEIRNVVPLMFDLGVGALMREAGVGLPPQSGGGIPPTGGGGSGTGGGMSFAGMDTNTMILVGIAALVVFAVSKGR